MEEKGEEPEDIKALATDSSEPESASPLGIVPAAQRFRTWLALFMVAIAALGAFSAYRAAIADEYAASEVHLLNEGQMLALAQRQMYLDNTLQAVTYWQQRDDVLRHAKVLEAIAARRGHPLGDEEALRATEERTVARMLFRRCTYYNPDLGKGALEPSLEEGVADDLEMMGFDAASKPGNPDIWPDERKKIDSATEHAEWLSLAVVFFVGTLFFATIAGLDTVRRRLWVTVGAVVALPALVLLARHDRIELVVAVVGGAVAAWILRALLSNNRPDESEEEHEAAAAELEPLTYAGSSLHIRLAETKFARRVVFLIALTALLSAGCGFLYSQASGQVNHKKAGTVDDQAELFRVNSAMRVVANTGITMATRWQEADIRSQAAERRFLLPDEGLLITSRAQFAREVDETKQVRQALLNELRESPNGTPPSSWKKSLNGILNSFDESPDSPHWLAQSQIWLPESKAFREWDEDNELAAAWHGKVAIYLAVLSMYAISLYLLGQSLSLKAPLAAKILIGFAVILVVTGSLLAAWEQRKPVASSTMSKVTDALSDTHKSVDIKDMVNLNKVIDEEKYADEHLKQRDFTYPGLLQDLGLNLYIRGLVRSRPADIEDGLKYTQRAIDRLAMFEGYPPLALMDKAIMLLALGKHLDALEALAAYKRLATPEDFHDGLRGIRDLELFNAECKGKEADFPACASVHNDLSNLKGKIVNAIWTPRPSGGRAVPVAVERVNAEPGGLSWRARIGATAQTMVFVWYRRNPRWNVWIPQWVSRQVMPRRDDGTIASFIPYLPVEGYKYCLPEGKYRLEIYANGKLVATTFATNRLAGYRPIIDSALNLAICRPKSWRVDVTHRGIDWTLSSSTHRSDFAVFWRRDVPRDSGAAIDALTKRGAERILRGPLRRLAGRSDFCGVGVATDWQRAGYTLRGHPAVLAHFFANGEFYAGLIASRERNVSPEQCAVLNSLVTFRGL